MIRPDIRSGIYNEDLATLSRLSAQKNTEKEQIAEVADEFEAMFMRMVMQSMKDTLDKTSNPFYGGLSEDIFEDMLYQEYASLMAKQHDFGIAESIQNQYETTNAFTSTDTTAK